MIKRTRLCKHYEEKLKKKLPLQIRYHNRVGTIDLIIVIDLATEASKECTRTNLRNLRNLVLEPFSNNVKRANTRV